MNRLWHERCFNPLHERRIDPTDPRSEPGNSAERARQRIEIEQTRKRKNGQEETGVIAIVFKPAARGPAKQSRSSRDRHGDFLGCPGTDLRGIRLGVAHNFAEVIAEGRVSSSSNLQICGFKFGIQVKTARLEATARLWETGLVLLLLRLPPAES